MTLIINDIHIKRNQKEAYIVACADRRLTYRKELNPKKKYNSGKKLFKIEYLNSCVSFWGNAIAKNKSQNYELLSSWIPNFIRHNSDCKTLLEFSERLRDRLNKYMHTDHLRNEASGFHLSGFNENSLPEFFHFSNCQWNPEKNKYTNITWKFGNVADDFLGRDFPGEFKWDKKEWNSIQFVGTQTYRNGDIKIHVSAWKKLDETFDEIFSHPNFKTNKEKNEDTIKNLYKFKLDFIGAVYSNWGTVKNVGGPFDIMILKPKKGVANKT
ncbi:MAG: hypothetical protein L3J35_02470 [Bacteroidales bacterium]|nr:hypothetical protein [Bacteroidales bacterium]